MQSIERDGSVERRVLLACISSTQFMSRVSGKLEKEPFRSKWSNLVYGWCVSYFTKYNKAPGTIIESLFADWSNKGTDPDTAKLVNRLLSTEDYSTFNEEELDYTIDLAERHFNSVGLERLEDELKLWREKDGTEAGIRAIRGFVPLNLRTLPSVSILRDTKVQKRSLENTQKSLIKFPGAAGTFFGAEFSEDSFIGVMAQSKGGKSFTLLDFGWRAMLQGRRVGYFQVGDLSENQVMRRFLRRAVYRPLEPKTIKYPLSIILPVGVKELALIDTQDKTYENQVSWKTAKRALRRIAEKTGGDIRLSYHPIKTVSALDIQAILESWDKEGWFSEIVIIDYAGNLAPIDNKMSAHEQTAMSWAMLRQISEKRKCCVITANQSNKEGFKSWVLTRSNFADSKMILAHVTAFIGVNRTDEESSRKIIRYNFINRREEEFSESRCLYCGSCLDICNPMVVSTLP